MADAATGLALSRPSAGPRRNVDGFRVVASGDMAGIAAEWGSLAGRSVTGNVFFGPEFALPAAEHLGEGQVAVAVVASRSGDLAAAAPFTRTRLGRIAPAVRLWSHKYAPLGVPLATGDDLAATLDRLIDGLAPDGSGLSVIVPEAPVGGPVAQALAALAARSGRPLVALDEHERAMLERGGTPDLRGLLPAHRRKELGRQMRRLGEKGPVTVESAIEPDRVRCRFEEFLALEMAGWKGQRGTALACVVADVEFAREAIRNLAAAGKARIESLRVGEHPVAILVTLIGGETAFTWKIAYDEDWARFSPGAEIMLEAPARIFADHAVKRIDSCATADHPMINSLWAGRLGIATLVLGPKDGGALFRIGVAAARAEIAARANVRQLRARFG